MNFEELIKAECARVCSLNNDPSHDFAHFKRVTFNALEIAKQEGADLETVMAAAWLHDYVNIPKSDPRRSQASRISAQAAVKFLASIGFQESKLEAVAHAIEAHSFSANIEAKTIEAKAVQDADRLDAIGAIGIARCFSVGGQMNAEFYSPDDPLAFNRARDDRKYSVDHFYVKLFKVAETLKTETARKMGRARVNFMKNFLAEMGKEAGWPGALS